MEKWRPMKAKSESATKFQISFRIFRKNWHDDLMRLCFQYRAFRSWCCSRASEKQTTAQLNPNELMLWNSPQILSCRNRVSVYLDHTQSKDVYQKSSSYWHRIWLYSRWDRWKGRGWSRLGGILLILQILQKSTFLNRYVLLVRNTDFCLNIPSCIMTTESNPLLSTQSCICNMFCIYIGLNESQVPFSKKLETCTLFILFIAF